MLEENQADASREPKASFEWNRAHPLRRTQMILKENPMAAWGQPGTSLEWNRAPFLRRTHRILEEEHRLSLRRIPWMLGDNPGHP